MNFSASPTFFQKSIKKSSAFPNFTFVEFLFFSSFFSFLLPKKRPTANKLNWVCFPNTSLKGTWNLETFILQGPWRNVQGWDLQSSDAPRDREQVSGLHQCYVARYPSWFDLQCNTLPALLSSVEKRWSIGVRVVRLKGCPSLSKLCHYFTDLLRRLFCARSISVVWNLTEFSYFFLKNKVKSKENSLTFFYEREYC